jgi:hypothetical protein
VVRIATVQTVVTTQETAILMLVVVQKQLADLLAEHALAVTCVDKRLIEQK